MGQTMIKADSRNNDEPHAIDYLGAPSRIQVSINDIS